MHFIKDLSEGEVTEHAHNKLMRYSKGDFTGPLLHLKFMKNQVKVYGSFHFVDELLRMAADYVGDTTVHVKGTIVWNEDLSEELASLGIKYSKVSKSRGIFKYQLDNDVALRSLVDSMLHRNMLINFKTSEISFTVKTAFPKPNKEFTNEFCKITFPTALAEQVRQEFLFDVEEDAKQVDIQHRILVDDIEVPDVPDFDQARRLAKRIGRIRRTITLDGGEAKTHEFSFKA